MKFFYALVLAACLGLFSFTHHSNLLAQDDPGAGSGEANPSEPGTFNSRLVFKGDPPQLTGTCNGVILWQGSTEAAGKIYLTVEIPSCTLKFKTSFYQAVCVASGVNNPVAVATAQIDPLDRMTISRAGGGNLMSPDFISYICVELAKPPSSPPDHSFQKANITGAGSSISLGRATPPSQTEKPVAFQVAPLQFTITDPVKEAVKEYCAAIKEDCIDDAISGGDLALCNSGYNGCIHDTNCEVIGTACLQKGLDPSLCNAAKAKCEKKNDCQENLNICKSNASTGWEHVACNNNYANCIKP